MCKFDATVINDLHTASILKKKYGWETSDNKWVMALPPFKNVKSIIKENKEWKFFFNNKNIR